MTSTRTPGSARAESWGRLACKIVGAFAVATMLLPVDAWGIDSTPRLALDKAGASLPLPPTPYLESTRWLNWRPSAPLFKIDTLLLPGSVQPGLLQIPSEEERSLPKTS